jgi:hypothetical protein
VTDAPAADFPDDIAQSDERLAWEVPETAAAAVLVAVAVLMVGGLVAGIVASTTSYGGITPSGVVAGNAISFGATWAGPLLAIALLGVVGLCWWEFQAWSDASEPDEVRYRVVEVAGHIRRAHRISQWTQVALLLICAGAAALVVGSLLLSTGGGGSANSVNWSRTIVEVANLLAVLVVAGVGVWIGRKINMDQESSD